MKDLWTDTLELVPLVLYRSLSLCLSFFGGGDSTTLSITAETERGRSRGRERKEPERR